MCIPLFYSPATFSDPPDYYCTHQLISDVPMHPQSPRYMLMNLLIFMMVQITQIGCLALETSYLQVLDAGSNPSAGCSSVQLYQPL